MDEKTKALYDAMMHQAQFNIERFDGRREYSWKVTLGFWAAILGSVSILKTDMMSISKSVVSSLIILVAMVIFVFLHYYWLRKVFEADKKDKDYAFRFRDEAIKLLKIDVEPQEEGKSKSFAKDWSFRFQLGTTIFLTLMLAFYLFIPYCLQP